MDKFCTCENTECRLHPKNHNYGCDRCIKKNLNNGEIPTCFFKMVDNDISSVRDFTVNGFVRHVEDAERKKGSIT